MGDWISRREWGAKRAKATTPFTPSEVKGVVLHHSAGPAPSIHTRCYDSVRAIQQAHLNKSEYNDIAYNLIVCPHGYTFEGRGYKNRGGANGTTASNKTYLSICVLGKNPKPTAKIAYQIKKRRFGVMKRYGFDARRLYPHSKFRPTACPGDPLRAFIQDGAQF